MGPGVFLEPSEEQNGQPWWFKREEKSLCNNSQESHSVGLKSP